MSAVMSETLVRFLASRSREELVLLRAETRREIHEVQARLSELEQHLALLDAAVREIDG